MADFILTVARRSVCQEAKKYGDGEKGDGVHVDAWHSRLIGHDN